MLLQESLQEVAGEIDHLRIADPAGSCSIPKG
jgi:hypothetical protein